MKRKTFAKQLMALGLSRNEANRLCREALDRMAYYRGSGLPVGLAWECILAATIGQLEDLLSVNAETTWWTGTGDKFLPGRSNGVKRIPGGAGAGTTPTVIKEDLTMDDYLDEIESAVNRGECSGLADIMVIIRDAPAVKLFQERAEGKNKTFEVERA